MSRNYSTAQRIGDTVRIKVKPRFLTEEKAAALQQAINQTVERFQAAHSETEVRIVGKLKQPLERPELKTRLVGYYRPATGEKKPIYVYSFRCNWRLTTRRICPVKWEQPSKGPADRNADRHWAAHEKAAVNNGSS